MGGDLRDVLWIPNLKVIVNRTIGEARVKSVRQKRRNDSHSQATTKHTRSCDRDEFRKIHPEPHAWASPSVCDRDCWGRGRGARGRRMLGDRDSDISSATDLMVLHKLLLPSYDSGFFSCVVVLWDMSVLYISKSKWNAGRVLSDAANGTGFSSRREWH